MPVARRAKVNEVETLLPAAIAAVTACATGMQAEATELQERLQTLRLPEPMAEELPALALTLDAEAGYVVYRSWDFFDQHINPTSEPVPYLQLGLHAHF